LAICQNLISKVKITKVKITIKQLPPDLEFIALSYVVLNIFVVTFNRLAPAKKNLTPARIYWRLFFTEQTVNNKGRRRWRIGDGDDGIEVPRSGRWRRWFFGVLVGCFCCCRMFFFFI